MQVGGAPTQRISKRNSTGNASWGVGPNTEADEKSAYNNVQVGDGPQQREIGFPISTDNASWRGPNTEKLDSQFLQTMQVGGGPNTEADEKSAYDNVQVGAGQR
ncbi:hypothetical protein [Staphylococcus aureus]|uniref:hypothetical protein n=1 Tax=Staphylococcus aureus TaxID=1280 RepID=UPI00123E469A|nr:hypothetical protein [Staphylococcus aureus]